MDCRDAVDVLFYCTKIDELILPMNSSTLNIIQQQYIVTEVFTQSGGAYIVSPFLFLSNNNGGIYNEQFNR